jgi:DHA1 family bicyclomycin/chloramphenicol resistance-like MFS transporter
VTHDTRHPRASPWLIANLLGQITFGLLAMTICLPSMQEWSAIFGGSQAAVQLTFSAFVLAFGSLQLLYGPLSDRHGRKVMLLIGLVLAIAGSVLAALASTLPGLIAARFLQGAGCAAGMVVGRSMVQDLFHGPQRTRVMAYVGMTMGLTPPLGTIIGGQLHARLGWQANFVLIATLATILLVATWRLGTASRKTPVAGSHWFGDMRAAYARLVREPSFLLYVAILAFTTAAFFAFLAGAPMVLGSYGVGPQGVGWYIGMVPMAYIAGNYLTSTLVRRHGERKLMLIGQLITLVGVGLMVVLAIGGLKSPLAISMPLMLLGIGHGLLTPTSLSGTVGLLPGLAGAAAAVAGLMQQTMGAAAGFAVGLLPLDGPFYLGCLMLGLSSCALVAQLMLRRRQAIAGL